MHTIFFYGLFMDETLLQNQGLHPKRIGPAVLADFKILIGSRATLAPCAGAAAYGVAMTLSAEEAERLYAEPSVSDYLPEPVQIQLLGRSETVAAVCYNLPPDLAGAGANADYAVKLSRLVRDLGFTSSYADEIADFARGDS